MFRSTKSKRSLETSYDILYGNLTLICKAKPGLKMEGNVRFEDFQKSRSSVVQSILYSLIFVLDREKCRRMLIWPPRCGPEAKEFRENVTSFLNERCKDFQSKVIPNVTSTFLNCTNPEKCIKFLTEFSTYVLTYLASKYEGVVILKAPSSWNNLSLKVVKYIEYKYQKRETEELEDYKSAVECAKIAASELLSVENNADNKSMRLKEEIEEALNELCSLQIKGYSDDAIRNQIKNNDNTYFLDMLNDVKNNKEMEIKFSQSISYFDKMINIFKLSNAILYPEDINYGQIKSALRRYFESSNLDTNMIFTNDDEFSIWGMLYGCSRICEKIIENKELSKYETQIEEARKELKYNVDEIQSNTDWYTVASEIKQYSENDKNNCNVKEKKMKQVVYFKREVEECQNELKLLNVIHGGISSDVMADKIFKSPSHNSRVYFQDWKLSENVPKNALRKGRVPL